MSIFKDTLKPFVASQLNARKSVISTDATRDPKFLMYTTGKNSWVRMVSFVDANVLVDPSNPKAGYRYQGQQLARKYVLEGGTLYNKPGTNDFSLRSGLLSKGSAYGSDIDRTYDISQKSKSGVVDRQFGLRPMPGITSVTVSSKSAYGSLREATIKYFAWDKHQLEELELLYMRTGYSVLLEWGWSEYLDHTIASGINDTPKGIDIKTFNIPTIDPFKSGLTEDGVYALIDQYSEKVKGNYDAMLGYIKNFSWQLLPNGGFECTTVLISRGEAISTLKLSSNTDTRLAPPIITTEGEPALTNFEKIFYNLQAYINQKETIDPNGSFVKAEKDKTNPAFVTSQVDINTATQQVSEIVNALKSTSFEAYDKATSVREPLGKGILGAYLLADGNAEQGTGIEYIPLNTFIAILNTYFTLKNETNQTLVKITLPQGTPCLASRNSVSIDPTTCVIKNSKAKLITGNDKGQGSTEDGFNPKLYNYAGQSGTGAYTHQSVTLDEFLLSDGNGDMGNILVSIDKIVRLYKSSNQGQDGVILLDYLQKLLNDISFALGGINDFKIFVDKNKAQIIDAKYLENGAKSARDTKYKFDLIGLKSICRDVKINSRIFESQSTMIAISAQNRSNIGDIYSSTQAYLNNGLTDRLRAKVGGNAQAEFNYILGLYNNLKNLQYYINLKCSGKEGENSIYKITVPQSNEIQSASSLLKTFQLQIASEDIDFKAIIPFELEIELDGIGGFVIGQVFTVDTSVLPRDYVRKHVGFIITGISQTLQNNDWTTTLKTQICLLDQDELKKENARLGNQDDLLKQINKLRNLNLKNVGIWSAYADYLVFLTKSAYLFGSSTNAFDLFSTIGNNDYLDSTPIPGSQPQGNKNTLYNYLKGKAGVAASENGKSIIYFEDYYKNVWYPYVSTKANLQQAQLDLIIPPDQLENKGAYTLVKIPYFDTTSNQEKLLDLNFDFNGVVANGLSWPDLQSNRNSSYGSNFLTRRKEETINDFVIPVNTFLIKNDKLDLVIRPDKTLNNQDLYNKFYSWLQAIGDRNLTTPSMTVASPARIQPLGFSVEVKRAGQ